jgi:hypothetical protein
VFEPGLDIGTPELIEISPGDVDLVFGPPGSSRSERIALKRSLLRGGETVRGGDWDEPAPRRFVELEVYRAIEARIAKDVPWEETEFYARVMKDFERGRSKWGCSTEEEFIARCSRLDELHKAIAAEGFRTQEELGTDSPHDEIRVGIRRDGRLLFLDGRHRLAIARVLGIDSIPVRVAVRHEEWGGFKQDVLDYASSHNGRVYQKIDHPDLRHVPAGHGDERIEMIEKALRPYGNRGLSLLDIGAHWGYMCQQLERLGFRCQGIELNKRSAEFAERISVATNSRFTIWRGSVFRFPDVEDFEVILALNIFHHFLKQRESHQELQNLLGRMRAEVIIFEAHKHDPPAQMAGAYRNYPPEEFVEFVSGGAGLSNFEELGAAPDGRRLFKLWR